MTRAFLNSFEPTTATPITGATVDLEVSDIEDAGIWEVLQTPDAAYDAWSILNAYPISDGAATPFIFKEPLRQAREVKVGLFARFIARAYLERYFNLYLLGQSMDSQQVLDVLAEHKPVLTERYGFTRLALFGSVARGDSGANGDIDVLVAFDSPSTSRRYFGVLFYLEDLFGRSIELVTEKALRAKLRPHVERETRSV